MLVLTRRKNESIVINNETTVTVLEVQGDKVRLGIEAPDSVRVDRQEVHKRRLLELAGDGQPTAATDEVAEPPTTHS